MRDPLQHGSGEHPIAGKRVTVIPRMTAAISIRRSRRGWTRHERFRKGRVQFVPAVLPLVEKRRGIEVQRGTAGEVL